MPVIPFNLHSKRYWAYKSFIDSVKLPSSVLAVNDDKKIEIPYANRKSWIKFILFVLYVDGSIVIFK